MDRALRTFAVVFGAASLTAVALGAHVAAHSGVGAQRWGLNLAAWILGATAAAGVARLAGPRAERVFVAAALLAVALTFAAEGLQGVHRWLQVGPVRVNAAELLMPAAVVALAAMDLRRPWPWVAAAAALLLLIAQPDASQATAVAVALVAAAAASPLRPVHRVAVAGLCAAAAAMAWIRPDPLAPVPEVEEIFRLAGEVSPMAAAVAAVSLATASAAPLMLSRRSRAPAPPALALGGYFLVSAVSPLLGAFPTPLVGIGVSPVLGFWLAAGLLVSLASRRAGAAAP
ncbi:MAG: hypothetical protein JNK30_07885 [Phenylobacterium sp.]|uniref:hypothetical protein n=1 Tax=Phenylobacterium sp. TaxID=1871053 RepID=UPI001A3EF113|nr:hypothetical protein [Phenylobacterium sp.]MBL8771289.1 hypothetical protein [Phenylobacterium sp.]